MTDAAGPTPPLPVLPCGRTVEGLVVQVADGVALDAHQRDCPYCRAARTELEGLWAPVRAVVGHRPAAPDGALDQALRRIRRLAGDAVWSRHDGDAGRTTIASRVIVVLSRHLAAQVPGVRAALSRQSGDDTVEITLAATYGQDLAALGDRIRAAVARGLREHGLARVAVNVVIDDVLDEG